MWPFLRPASLSLLAWLFDAACPLTGIAAADDLARGRVWRWSRAPNYARCTDARDSMQLSDGRRAPDEYIGLHKETVGWELQAGDPVAFVIDLGIEAALDSLVVHTALFPRTQVHPPSLVCAAGTERSSLAWCGAFDARSLPSPDPDKAQRSRLVVPLRSPPARYVLVTAITRGPFLVIDEIELHGIAASDRRFQEKMSSKPTELQASDLGPLGRTFSPAETNLLCTAQRRAWAMRRALPAPATPLTPGVDVAAEEAARFAGRAAAWRNAGMAPLTVRRVDPWAPTTPWTGLQSGMSDTLWLWPGGWGAAAIEVANADHTAQRLPAKVATRSAAALRGTLREVLAVESRDGGWAGDALPLAADSLRIEPGQVRQLWLDVDATRAKPGRHRLEVHIGGQRITVPVRVVDWRAPAPPLGAIDWTYPTKMGVLRGAPEEAVRDNVAHGVDTWCLPWDSVPWPDPASIDDQGHLTRAPDFKACDRQLAVHPVEKARSFGWYLHFVATNQDPSTGRFRHAWMSKPWQRAFSEWLDLWLRHLQERGIDQRKLWLAYFDETTDAKVLEFFAYLRSTRPNLPAMLTVTRNATPEDLKKLGTAVRMPILEREALVKQTEWIESMLAQGIDVWTYDVIEPAKTASPLRDYRDLAWEAWARRLAGCGFWAYGDTGEQASNAWSDFDDARNDFHVVYGRDGAPRALRAEETFVPSKRWQAFRIGMQETALLEASLAKRPGLRAEVLGALGRADFEAEAWRRRLLRGR